MGIDLLQLFSIHRMSRKQSVRSVLRSCGLTRAAAKRYFGVPGDCLVGCGGFWIGVVSANHQKSLNDSRRDEIASDTGMPLQVAAFSDVWHLYASWTNYGQKMKKAYISVSL